MCFARDGAQTVFWGRFSAILRTSSALLAGLSRLPYPRFLLWNAAGGCLWVLTLRDRPWRQGPRNKFRRFWMRWPRS